MKENGSRAWKRFDDIPHAFIKIAQMRQFSRESPADIIEALSRIKDVGPSNTHIRHFIWRQRRCRSDLFPCDRNPLAQRTSRQRLNGQPHCQGCCYSKQSNIHSLR
eukprot:6173364-Pleurochrysis_carterae.AAC.6